jgi:hypothetical protein
VAAVTAAFRCVDEPKKLYATRTADASRSWNLYYLLTPAVGVVVWAAAEEPEDSCESGSLQLQV